MKARLLICIALGLGPYAEGAIDFVTPYSRFAGDEGRQLDI